jgi:hypothetical protein
MSFKITVEGETLAELGANLAIAAEALAATPGNDAPRAGKGSATSGSASSAFASSRASKGSSPSDTDEGPRGGSAGKSKSPSKDDADEDELDYERDVKPQIVALSKEFGRDVALEVLEQFTNAATDEPCTKGQEVSPEDWPKFLKAIKKARAKAEAEAD